jgi:hypothetical protein
MTARYLLPLVLSPFLFTRGLEDQALLAQHPRPCRFCSTFASELKGAAAQ